MELFKLVGKIAIEGSDQANSEISSVTGKAESAGGKIGAAVSKIGGAVVKAGQIAATGVAVAAGGIAALTKQAVGAYADYEQLTGGVETLFGTSAKSFQEYVASVGGATAENVEEIKAKYVDLVKAQDTVMKNAENAYKTSGLSMNDYMETVTSFSASLIQSLGGDTLKAASVADKAIVDMSDNANKMGSDMSSIQNAYQGFAKQNYTMLDNLKLGYGGTKEEMQRLLKDADELNKQQGITTKYSLESFSDIVEAIHVVQDNMGITGTTAKEAAGTISGSIGMMKASWENFITGMADPDQDFGALMDNLVDSVITVADNIAPKLIETVPRVVEGISQVTEKLIPYIQPMIQKLLPPLINGAVKLVAYLVQNLPSLLSSLGGALWDALKTMFDELWNMLTPEVQDNVTGIFSKISETFGQIWEFCSQIWNDIGQPMWDSILNVIMAFAANWSAISETIKSYLGIVFDFWMTAWESIGRPIWEMISMAVSETANMFAAYMPQITAFFSEAVEGIRDTWENHLKPAFDAIGHFLKNVVKPAFELVFKTIILPLVKTAFEGIQRLWTGTLKPVLDGIIDFILGTFTGDWKRGLQGILNIVVGIFNGIKNAVQTPMDAIKNIVNSTIEYIKEKFNFEWKLPEIKLPHFKISGQFSVNPPSVPTFAVDWYRKAMDDPLIMNSPTAFGINKLGQIMAGGEAGSEVVSGTATLMNMISEAVAAKNEELIDVLYEIYRFLIEMLPKISDKQLVMDTGAVVGVLAPVLDAKFGNMTVIKGRGV